MHVDHVGRAAVEVCVNSEVRGVLEVRQMREAIGWREDVGSHVVGEENVSWGAK
jgi:hypothetical protein